MTISLTFSDVLDLARQHTYDGNLTNAEREFTRAIELAGSNPQPYMARAQFYIDQEEYEKAIADYSAAIEIMPMPMFYVARCNAYEAAGQLEKAIADCTTALSLPRARKANLHHQRGTYYAQLQDFAAAVADFSVAIEHNPRSFHHYKHRALAYGQVNEREKAAADWQQVIDICGKDHPESVEAQAHLASR